MTAHDPGVDAARMRAATAERTVAASRGSAPGGPFALGEAVVRVGTAGWTDPSLLAPGVFYPAGVTSAEGRLRHYASHFSLVEVDSSYYALPTRRIAERWVERTPSDFVFDVKAFAWMTNHATDASRLPRPLRDALPPSLAGATRLYPRDVPPEIRDEAWRLFADAMVPLRDAGKLGAVFLQYPPWVRPSHHAAQVFGRARARLGALPIAVEFRHGDWLSDAHRERTFALLRDHDMSYVIVDEPQGTAASVPPTVAVPVPRLAVLRMHGHRVETWTTRGTSVLEKFRYLYDDRELAAWVPKIVEIAGESEQLHLVFNNCYGNYGTTNALEATALLLREPSVLAR